jgi:hypothetical protein
VYTIAIFCNATGIFFPQIREPQNVWQVCSANTHIDNAWGDLGSYTLQPPSLLFKKIKKGKAIPVTGREGP